MVKGVDGKNRERGTFSMFVKAPIFAWRSLAFASCMARAFLSSIAVAPIVVMLRLIRSGLWTIRPLVRCMLSRRRDVSEFMFSFFKMRFAFSTLSASMSFTTAWVVSFVEMRWAVIAAFSARISSHFGSSFARWSLRGRLRGGKDASRVGLT